MMEVKKKHKNVRTINIGQGKCTTKCKMRSQVVSFGQASIKISNAVTSKTGIYFYHIIVCTTKLKYPNLEKIMLQKKR